MTITQLRTAVELRAVTKIHGTGTTVTALDAVDLAIPPATFTAVMGPSGSGKSTLLHCAAGLDRATSGDVIIDGVAIGGLSERALTRLRRERVGFVFQAFNLIPALSAAQNVALPLRLAGKRPAPGQVAAMLAEVGLADRVGHRPSELSGGQQQRVALARALVSRPAVLFADEPTGALDTNASREVLRLLRLAVDRHAQTIVMVTHDPWAAAHADQVVFLADGRIAGQMTPTGPDGRLADHMGPSRADGHPADHMDPSRADGRIAGHTRPSGADGHPAGHSHLTAAADIAVRMAELEQR